MSESVFFWGGVFYVHMLCTAKDKFPFVDI